MITAGCMVPITIVATVLTMSRQDQPLFSSANPSVTAAPSPTLQPTWTALPVDSATPTTELSEDADPGIDQHTRAGIHTPGHQADGRAHAHPNPPPRCDKDAYTCADRHQHTAHERHGVATGH